MSEPSPAKLTRNLPNQCEVTVKGLHHSQEDSPKEIAEALREFVLSDRA
jgi:haloalkane dehalogenase